MAQQTGKSDSFKDTKEMTGEPSGETRKNTQDASLEKTQLSEAAMAKAIAYLTQGQEPGDVTNIGELRLPSKGPETGQCQQIMSILKEYVTRNKVTSPFSIAVFGPPGSGKSFYVRQILESLKTELASLNVRQFVSKQVVVNLSQLSSPKELAQTFNKAGEDEEIAQVFFFDEFDAPLNGLSLGWLRWFLAPMQDSKFFYEGVSVSIKKAIFVFAGGTAASFDEFKQHAESEADYRDKKVPDFISRLRGFIDIQGLNHWDERPLRRALLLSALLDRRWPEQRKKGEGFPLDKELAKKLLSNAHFVHGARSMEALLDMSLWDRKGNFAKEHLPDEKLKILHISRGPLDNKMIGISTGQKELETSEFLKHLTNELLHNGATLAYGGDFIKDGTLHRIVKAAEEVPDDLVIRTEKRIHNYLGYPSFNRSEVKEQHDKWDKKVEFHRLPTLSDLELIFFGQSAEAWFSAYPLSSSEKYDAKNHLAWALSLFRMRVRLVQDISALVVFGGKEGESWGRFSGIAEEVMLALAMGKAVYVLGGREGAAQAVGKLLGLHENLVNPETCLLDGSNDEFKSLYENAVHAFAVPGHSNLPQTIAELRNYLFEHSATTAAWPSNGLTLAENRTLFSTSITEAEWGECIKLIIQGMTHPEWKRQSRTSRQPKTDG